MTGGKRRKDYEQAQNQLQQQRTKVNCIGTVNGRCKTKHKGGDTFVGVGVVSDEDGHQIIDHHTTTSVLLWDGGSISEVQKYYNN